MSLEPPFRHATIEDAPILAELVNHAGEGLRDTEKRGRETRPLAGVRPA